MLCTVETWAFDINKFRNSISHLSSDSLFNLAQAYANEKGVPDSATVCYDMVVKRYHNGMSKAEKETVVRALSGLWYLYSLVYFDQAKGFKHLDRAREICEQAGLEVGKVYLNFACAYQNIAEQTGDREMYDKALQFLLLSFNKCAEEGSDNIHLAFGNMCEVAYEVGRMDTLAHVYQRYHPLAKASDWWYADYNELLYKGTLLMHRGLWLKAAETFARQEDLLVGVPYSERHLILSRQNRGKALWKGKRLEQAKQALLEAEALANQYDQSDASLLNCQLLAQICGDMGDLQQKNRYQARYLAIKDTLLNYKQISSIKDTGFLSQMERKDAELAATARSRSMAWTISGLAGAVLLILATCYVLLRRKNRQLIETNDTLYRQAMRQLTQQEAEEERIKQLSEQTPTEQKQDGQADNDNDHYRDIQLMEKIREVMVDQRAVFNEDFCARKLTELTGINYQYLSAAINNVTGENFTSLVNLYRVREACHMLTQAKYDNLTIEAIGQAVGYKTRQTFLRAFKAQMGMLPSDFRKSAQRAGNEEIKN